MPHTDEQVVYFHGVQPTQEVESHYGTYRELHGRIRRHQRAFPAEFIGTEWGWDADRDGALKGQEHLTSAQLWLGQQVMKQFHAPTDFTLNPLRAAINGMRDLMFYGFGDMFYYVCSDGKSSVRYAVAAQIVRQLVTQVGSLDQLGDRRLSLTLIGHSAGSVVAFDLLFHLFFPNSDVKMCGEIGAKHTFIEEQRVKAKVEESVVDELETLRALAQNGRLRLRRLYTFGSPLAMLALRSQQVLELYSAGKGVDPSYHGFVQNPPDFGTPLAGPRWINMWDRDDPIAWPNTALIRNDDGRGRKVAKDEYIDVSDSVQEAHGKYWTSSSVARTIGRSW